MNPRIKSENLYDVIFTCMFSLATEKHLLAASGFSNFGIVNIPSDLRVKLNAIVHEDAIEDFKKISFDPCMDIEIVKSKFNDITNKIHGFYQSSFKSNLFSCRWHMQVDDDSMTDVAKMIDMLDDYYDYRDPLALNSARLFSHGYRYKNRIDTKDNMLNGYFYPGTIDCHTWESSVLSHGAIKKIIEKDNDSPFLVDYFEKILKSRGTPGDQWMEPLCKICRIPVILSDFIAYGNILEDFSINGGNYFHIHYVKDHTFKNLFSEYWFKNNILSKDLPFIFEDQAFFPTQKRIQFLPDGNLVSDLQIEKLQSWSINNSYLLVYDSRRMSMLKFKINDFLRNKGFLLAGQFTCNSSLFGRVCAVMQDDDSVKKIKLHSRGLQDFTQRC